MKIEFNDEGQMVLDVATLVEEMPDDLLIEISKRAACRGVVMAAVADQMIDGFFEPDGEGYWCGVDDEIQAARLRLINGIPDLKTVALAEMLTAVEQANQTIKAFDSYRHTMATRAHDFRRGNIPTDPEPEIPTSNYVRIGAEDVRGWLNGESAAPVVEPTAWHPPTEHGDSCTTVLMRCLFPNDHEYGDGPGGEIGIQPQLVYWRGDGSGWNYVASGFIVAEPGQWCRLPAVP